MYSLGLNTCLLASHRLPDAVKNEERGPHAHPYRIEINLSGERQDGKGCLMDIDEVARSLDETLAPLRGRLLNDCPDFAGALPTMEGIARVICNSLWGRLCRTGISRLEVKVWEDDRAWGGFERKR